MIVFGENQLFEALGCTFPMSSSFDQSQLPSHGKAWSVKYDMESRSKDINSVSRNTTTMSDSTQPGRDDGLPNRTRAHRGGDHSPRRGPPGRETSAATSNYRREFLAIGNRTGSEKDRVGVFFADVGRIAGEIGTLTLPVMLYLPVAQAGKPFAFFETWLLALMTMIVVGTLLRGGWITPPFTDAPGWVRLFPTLILLRLVYFNGALLVSIHGGSAVAGETGVVAAGLLWSLSVSGAATLLFPRVVDGWMAGRR